MRTDFAGSRPSSRTLIFREYDRAMATKGPNRAREVIIGAVENQIRKNDPPEAKETLARLIQSGQSREDALRLIAGVLANEMFEVMKNKAHFDNARYVANLARLPELPRDGE